MENSEEKWIEEVFQSMQGSERAKPSPELFAEIEKLVLHQESRVVPVRQWKYVAVAAVLVLIANVASIVYYAQPDEIGSEAHVVNDVYSQSLITSYQIYGE